MKITFGYKCLTVVGKQPHYLCTTRDYFGTEQDITTFDNAMKELYKEVYSRSMVSESILFVVCINGSAVSNSTISNRNISFEKMTERLISFLTNDLSWQIGNNLPTVTKGTNLNRELQFIIYPDWKEYICPEALQKMPDVWLMEYYHTCNHPLEIKY